MQISFRSVHIDGNNLSPIIYVIHVCKLDTVSYADIYIRIIFNILLQEIHNIQLYKKSTRGLEPKRNNNKLNSIYTIHAWCDGCVGENYRWYIQ